MSKTKESLVLTGFGDFKIKDLIKKFNEPDFILSLIADRKEIPVYKMSGSCSQQELRDFVTFARQLKQILEKVEENKCNS